MSRGALYRDEAVVLRTYKLGEADRIVVLLTRGRGKVRAVAKGVRKTKSKFGARLEPDHPGLQAIRVCADPVVGVDERGTCHGFELAPTLVEHELDMGERLQARSEPRLGLANALGDSSHASPVLGIDMQDAVGFAEPE